MAQYQTMQKKALKDFLSRHRDRAFTIEEITNTMREEGGDDMPGKSTIYRLITAMLKEGGVRRFVREGSRNFVYQIMDCEKCGEHLHLKCKSCGRLLHMNSEASDKILNQIMQDNSFKIDEISTVLMGVCKDCHKGEKVK